MGFAPKGLNVGDVFESDGRKLKVTKVVSTPSYNGYETEIVTEEPEQIELAELPFSDVDKTPRKRRRKTE